MHKKDDLLVALLSEGFAGIKSGKISLEKLRDDINDFEDVGIIKTLLKNFDKLSVDDIYGSAYDVLNSDEYSSLQSISKDLIKLSYAEIKALIDKGDFEDEGYVWIMDIGKFLQIRSGNFHNADVASINLGVSQKEIRQMVADGRIGKYRGVQFKKNPEPGYFSPMRVDRIVKHSANPSVGSGINILFNNLCNGKKESIEWLERAVWQKYSNIDDPRIPAVVLSGPGGSGKGTFMSLLGAIFGKENVKENLGQQNLESQFDVIKGDAIAVEFAEITSMDTRQDKLLLNKLKNLIFAEKITVNPKNVQPYQTTNITWFFISSNNDRPLVLDSSFKGNRRFSIINTGKPMTEDEANEVYKDLKDRETIANFLAYLKEKFGDVEGTTLAALENDDKLDLMEKGRSEHSIFWEMALEDFAGKRVKVRDVVYKANSYADDNGLNEKEFCKYLKRDLPPFVHYKKMRIDGTPEWGFEFDETDSSKLRDAEIVLEEVKEPESFIERNSIV